MVITWQQSNINKGEITPKDDTICEGIKPSSHITITCNRFNVHLHTDRRMVLHISIHR